MSDKKDLDSFWDIEKLIPQKKTSTLSPFSTKEKTVTVKIDGESDISTSQRKLNFNEKSNIAIKPKRVYFPGGSLIKKVSVIHSPDKFDFHANFKKACELYFDFVGNECPFAPFYSYMPQYTQLTQPQKNYYFYWRTMLRRGQYIKTDYSYFYLYVYEILNLPELISPPEGLTLLVNAWKAYRKELPNIDANMALWVQDYCLVYGLSAPIEEISDFIYEVISVSRFKEFYFSSYERFGAHGVAALLGYLSDYDWRKGKYAGGDNKEVYTRHLLGAMGMFMKHFLSYNFHAIEGGNILTRNDNAFRMALLTGAVKYKLEVEYRQVAEEPEARALVTSALKYTENKLRALLGVKSRLSVKELPLQYSVVIDRYFEELFAKVNKERRMASRPEYEKLYEAESEELSSVGADEIERASWETTARLVVEDEEDTVEPSIIEPRNEGAVSDTLSEDFSYGLTDMEIDFIGFAYDGQYEKMRAITKELSTFADVIADKINEAFATNFGDVILENLGEGYTIIPDYREDVKIWLMKIVK